MRFDRSRARTLGARPPSREILRSLAETPLERRHLREELLLTGAESRECEKRPDSGAERKQPHDEAKQDDEGFTGTEAKRHTHLTLWWRREIADARWSRTIRTLPLRRALT